MVFSRTVLLRFHPPPVLDLIGLGWWAVSGFASLLGSDALFLSLRDFGEVIEPFYVPHVVWALSIPCEHDGAFLFLLGTYIQARHLEK